MRRSSSAARTAAARPAASNCSRRRSRTNYGLTFNGGAIVNFDGFKDIVKKLGGVDMYVDETTTSIHHGYVIGDPTQHAAPYKIDQNTGVPNCPGNYLRPHPIKCALPGVTPVQYKKGIQHLSAYEALDFVRCRDGLPYTDYDRQRHQQQFIKALMQEAYNKGLSDPLKLDELPVLDLARRSRSRGAASSIADWIFTLKGISPSSIVTIKTNDGKYVHYTGPAPDSRQALNVGQPGRCSRTSSTTRSTSSSGPIPTGSPTAELNRALVDSRTAGTARTLRREGEVGRIAYWGVRTAADARVVRRPASAERRCGRRSLIVLGSMLGARSRSACSAPRSC